MIILLLGVVLGGRKSLWGAFVGASVIVLLPNLLSNRHLFQLFSGLGFAMALAAGLRGLVKRTTRPFQALAPVVAMGILVVGGLLVENTEDWRKAIFALMLFSVVVGLPEGLMGFLSIFLAKLFRVPHAPLPEPSDIEDRPAAPRRRWLAPARAGRPQAPLRRREGRGRDLHDHPLRAPSTASSAPTARERAPW